MGRIRDVRRRGKHPRVCVEQKPGGPLRFAAFLAGSKSSRNYSPPRPGARFQAEGVGWWGLSLMLIEAGYEIAFECPAQTPMLLQLNVHPSRDADLRTPDRINSDPPLSTRSYIDHFGNRVTRVEVPAGLVAFSNRFVIHDSGEPDETPVGTVMTPIAGLPDDVLLFLVSSRYCDSDKLADFAWARFGEMAGGSQRVQAICDFVHAKIRVQLSRRKPNPLRQRFHARGCRRLPRLRASRHHALPVHEYSGALLHRLSRRHRRSGRYQSHGFQRLGRSLSQWPLVHDRRASQPFPHRPHCHGTRS